MNGFEDALAEPQDEGVSLVAEWLRSLFGLTFPGARRLLLQNRIQQRMDALGVFSTFDYFFRLRSGEDASEVETLIDLVTNGETYFFREEEQILALAQIAPSERRGERFRVLSAGCSTGEEAYTLAIRLSESLGGPHLLTVDAVDLDSVRLRQAEIALYGDRSLRGCADEERLKYFVRHESGLLRVREPYRSPVRFRRLNLVEPVLVQPTAVYDAIFCRNVLIYFSEPALDAALARLVSWLRVDGILLLGHSESAVGRTPSLRAERMGEFIVYRREGAVPEAGSHSIPQLLHG